MPDGNCHGPNLHPPESEDLVFWPCEVAKRTSFATRQSFFADFFEDFWPLVYIFHPSSQGPGPGPGGAGPVR